MKEVIMHEAVDGKLFTSAYQCRQYNKICELTGIDPTVTSKTILESLTPEQVDAVMALGRNAVEVLNTVKDETPIPLDTIAETAKLAEYEEETVERFLKMGAESLGPEHWADLEDIVKSLRKTRKHLSELVT